jgi:hypothetical protein
MRGLSRKALAGVPVAALALSLTSVVGAAAAPSDSTLYVAPGGGAPGNGDSSCADAGYSTVQSAVTAAPSGGTVIVCAGTYKESVTLTTDQLTLKGQPGAVIDATGSPYGYAVGIAADSDTVRGLTVENAPASQNGGPGDGIITAGLTGFDQNGQPQIGVGNNALIADNAAHNNADAGVNLESTTGTIVTHNAVTRNGIGVLITDDIGQPSAHNTVSDNVSNDNSNGCGIVIGEHTGAGIHDNRIIGNTANRNGLKSQGGGILIGGGGPGGIYNNLIASNRATGNALGGITMHVHAGGGNYSGNKFIDNVLGRNNVKGDLLSAKPKKMWKPTTGIFIGSATKVSVTVKGNFISHDRVGVFTAGPAKLHGKHSNAFKAVAHDFKSVAKYSG